MKPNKRKPRRAHSAGHPARRPDRKPEDVGTQAATGSGTVRELGFVIAIWLVLGIAMSLLAAQNLSVPGLYYDEAVFAGTAKDFLTSNTHGTHMPGFQAVEFSGRPFPFFVQSYLGALKSWLLIPSFQFFGQTVAVLRASNLFWGIVSLLFFMLATWRWLGLRMALIAGPILAVDPAYFFLSIIDWGVAVPSFLCRCVSFFFAVIWWQNRRAAYIFLAAFFAGLGFFNKIDFAVLLIAVTGAGVLCFGRGLWRNLTMRPSAAAFAVTGFLLGSGAMLLKIPGILSGQMSGANPSQPGELTEKVNTIVALYDGSYFYRLMDTGGMFEKMYSEPVGWLPVFGFLTLVGIVVCLMQGGRKASDPNNARIGRFLVAAIALATLGIILLPGAVRIHHAVLVYPLPHLTIAFAAGLFLQRLQSQKTFAVRMATWAILLGLFAAEIHAIYRTQALVRETGGRGRWSEAFDRFCQENKSRNDLAIVSLDWGFNEQLNFLTDGPQLSEPFWGMRGPFPGFGPNSPALPVDPKYVYLVHPAEYSLFPFGEHYLKQARAADPEVQIHPYSDRQNRVAFYTIQFPRR